VTRAEACARVKALAATVGPGLTSFVEIHRAFRRLTGAERGTPADQAAFHAACDNARVAIFGLIEDLRALVTNQPELAELAELAPTDLPHVIEIRRPGDLVALALDPHVPLSDVAELLRELEARPAADEPVAILAGP
jgi:hypothetical protein